MKATVKMTLAVLLSAAIPASAVHAAGMYAESVSIVYIDTLDDSGNRSDFNALTQKAQFPHLTSGARAEAASDPAIAHELRANNINPKDVVQIDTAANGGKIVYVR